MPTCTMPNSGKTYIANEFGMLWQVKRKAAAERKAKEARAAGLTVEVVPPVGRGYYKVEVVK